MIRFKTLKNIKVDGVTINRGEIGFVKAIVRKESRDYLAAQFEGIKELQLVNREDIQYID